MKTKKAKRVPRFGMFRVIIPGLLLCFLLLGMLNLATIRGIIGGDDSGAEGISVSIEGGGFDPIGMIVNPLLLIAGIAFVIVYQSPISRAVKAFRKGTEAPPVLLSRARRRLPRTPHVAGLAIPGAMLVMLLVSAAFDVRRGTAPLDDTVYVTAINVFALGISALFINLWQKHRVQRFYLSALYRPDELAEFGPYGRGSSIVGNLFAIVMAASILPLSVVAIFLASGVSFLDRTTGLSPSEKRVAFGMGADELRAGRERGAALFFDNVDDNQFLENRGTAASPMPYFTVVDSARMLYGIATCMVMVLVYVFFIVRWNAEDFMHPIRDLRAGMRRLKEGDQGVAVPATTVNELGDLTLDFNRMVKGLEERDTIKNLFGRYLASEIYDAIMDGRVNLDGARYEATVMFTDIRDFTSISQTMPPEAVFAFLNEYLESMIEAITRSGGIIDKFLGDGILAVFGLPVPSNDHAERAFRAALAMRDALEALNEKRKARGDFPIEIGAGLHTGSVIAGNVGNERKMQFTVIGDTVNMASRVEGVNKRAKSHIVMSEATWNLLPQELRSLKPVKRAAGVELKGIRDPVTLYVIGAP